MIPRIGKKPTAPLKAQSSNVVGFIHDPDTGNLDVTFHGGRVYRYENVSKDTYHRLRQAPSKGTFITTEIAEHHNFKRLKVGLRPTSD